MSGNSGAPFSASDAGSSADAEPVGVPVDKASPHHAELDRLRSLASYSHRAYSDRPELKQALEVISAARGAKCAQQAMHNLLLSFADRRDAQQLPYTCTDEVEAKVANSLMRIRERCLEDYQFDDRFLKDLALATGNLFPAGERVVEPASVLQRALMLSAGPAQLLRFCKSVGLAGGTKPVFRLHVHLDEAAHLSDSTWRASCCCLARMLQANPAIKGIVGGSWFYDPALPAVSPRLAFINDVLKEAGASWFYAADEHENSGALVTSETRRRLYAEKSYQPRTFVVFLPRRAALHWLKKQSPMTEGTES